MAASVLDDRDQVDAEALALELGSARRVTRSLRKAVARLVAIALAEAAKARLAQDGQLTPQQQEAARERLNAAIGALSISVAGQTAAAVTAAVTLALGQEKRILPSLGVTMLEVRRELEHDPVLSRAGDATQQILADAIGTVRRAAEGPLSTAKDLEGLAGRAGSVTARVERQVRFVTNRAVNQTTVEIVKLAPPPRPATVGGQREPLTRIPRTEEPPISINGLRVVWYAERDACLVCLALSGHVIDPNAGQGFDEEATFGAPGSVPGVWPPGMPLMGPPRHPSCRCRLRIIAADNTAVPEALKREAERTVARGWSGHASKRARLGAADRLIRTPNRLPRTVNERAARSVAQGSFPTRHYSRTNLRVD